MNTMRALSLFVFALVTFAVAGCSPAAIHHRLHWMLYGQDRVWYHGRTYLHAGIDTLTDLRGKYGALHPTGEKVMGMPVLETEAAMTSSNAPTVLMLEKGGNTCIVYVLSGGP